MAAQTKLTEDDLFVAINWCDIDPHAEDYAALQRVKFFLETQMRVMKSRRQHEREKELAKARR